MKKMVVIEQCCGCPFMLRNLHGQKFSCGHANKRLPFDAGIPNWCPLPNSEQEELPTSHNSASAAILRRKDIEKIIDCVYHHKGFGDNVDPSTAIRELFPDLYVAVKRT